MPFGAAKSLYYSTYLLEVWPCFRVSRGSPSKFMPSNFDILSIGFSLCFLGRSYSRVESL